MWHIIALTL